MFFLVGWAASGILIAQTAEEFTRKGVEFSDKKEYDIHLQLDN